MYRPGDAAALPELLNQNADGWNASTAEADGALEPTAL